MKAAHASHSYNRELDTRPTKYFKYRMAHRTLAQRKQRGQFVIALAIVLLVFINRKQRRHRNFLSRSSLLPNPSEGTPWQALYAENDDRAYIVTMGVGVAVFQKILQSGFADTWNSFLIPRNNTRSAAHHDLDSAPWMRQGLLVLFSTTSTVQWPTFRCSRSLL